jgi:hypothetical protein
MTVGQPRTSTPFIMMRFVGRTFGFFSLATNGVEAHPTIRKRAPNFTQRRLSTEMSPPTPS